MIDQSSSALKTIVSILMFPLFFQGAFIAFAWGAGDPGWLMLTKRIFLLLPVLAFVASCWLTIACLLSVIVRPNRQAFVTALFVTWWDLGKAVAAFWGGVFYFVLSFIAGLLGTLKVAALGLWALILDIVFLPFRVMRNMGQNIVGSKVPWVAVGLMIFWCLIEATIFTYVTSPLVIDTLSNITGEQLPEALVRLPLFMFLLIVVLGSYAVLATFLDSFKSKKIYAILGIAVIEIIVMMVEVVFLYREFVDSLVPWLAQYSEDFELGMFGTLAISTMVWFGIRSLSWFLFAMHGTPPIMAFIQGKHSGTGERQPENREKHPASPKKNHTMELTVNFIQRLKGEIDWIQDKADFVLGAFMLPPLHLVGAVVNFCTLLVTSNHLFEIPFRSMREVTNTKKLLQGIEKRNPEYRVLPKEGDRA